MRKNRLFATIQYYFLYLLKIKKIKLQKFSQKILFDCRITTTLPSIKSKEDIKNCKELRFLPYKFTN